MKSTNLFINLINLIVRAFKLSNITIRVILDTHHLNIISNILCFDIFSLFRAIYHNTIHAII